MRARKRWSHAGQKDGRAQTTCVPLSRRPHLHCFQTAVERRQVQQGVPLRTQAIDTDSTHTRCEQFTLVAARWDSSLYEQCRVMPPSSRK